MTAESEIERLVAGVLRGMIAAQHALMRALIEAGAIDAATLQKVMTELAETLAHQHGKLSPEALPAQLLSGALDGPFPTGADVLRMIRKSQGRAELKPG